MRFSLLFAFLLAAVAPALSAPSIDGSFGVVIRVRAGSAWAGPGPPLRSRSSPIDQLLDRANIREAEPLFPPQGADLELRRSLGLDRIFVIPLHADPRTLLDDLANCPDVETVEAMSVGSAAGTGSILPNDPFFGDQWGLRNPGTLPGSRARADIGATDAWHFTTGDPSVIVAVLDTGLRWDHPDLAGRTWTNAGEIPDNAVDDDGNGFVDDVRGWNFAYGNANPYDDSGHGTHVAGIIGATGNNGMGYAGIDWGCTLMPVKVLNGSAYGVDTWWASGVYYAANNGARVINMSLVEPTGSFYLVAALQYAVARGCFIAAAMGNDGSDVPSYPAVCPETVAVGATDAADRRAPFSNVGQHIDVVAPGVNIASLSAEGGYGVLLSGTSMATAMVSGVGALIAASRPDLTPGAIAEDIRSTADDGVGAFRDDTPGFDPYYGYGRINARRALLHVAPYMPAAAFFESGGSTIALASGVESRCVLFEPVGGSFAPGDLDPASIVLRWNEGVNTAIAAQPGSIGFGGDRNANGVYEISACFSRADLRRLLEGASERAHLTLFLEAALGTGIPVRAPLHVVVTGTEIGVAVAPNPVRSHGTLTVRTSDPGPLRARLFDCRGRLVRTLIDYAAASPGYHDAAFDTKAGDGSRFASGVYYLRVETPGRTIVERITFMK